MTTEVQRQNDRVAAQAIAPLATGHSIMVVHGNGPQVGLLSLQAESYDGAPPYPLDVMDAGTQGMIGYLIQQELRNLDLAGELLAEDLRSDLFLMVTDVDGAYLHWGQPEQRRLGDVTPGGLAGYEFAAGSMGPKVEAATRFVARTGRRAAIGSLADIAGIVAGTAGTSIVAQKATAGAAPGS